ncbi:MAG TPA: hypothetical protein VHX60_13030 [Acidobacteriaceae bacterium]|jgi:hypothetical protein|nr:hypothetical protein [Acidobacteriaceae bacterium]
MRRQPRVAWQWTLLLVCALAGKACPQSALPDAPMPVAELRASLPDPPPQETFPPAAPRHRIRMPGLEPNYLPLPQLCVTSFCSAAGPRTSCCEQIGDQFSAYLKQNAIHIYTPRELAAMAVRGVVDPFNLLTIAGTSAISIGTDSHSPYGPGMLGFAKLSGTSLTEDMTNAFVETFLIPSIDHQDPRFHRMPNAPLKMRVFHCIYQPIWTDSDTGKGMFNYSTVVGAVVDEAVDAAYVPFRRVGWGAGADRISINLATTPIGNFVTEFVPDVARHINVSVVIVQRVIDRVAIEESGGTP